MSIELPVATRHYRDMTEKLLKVTLNPNKEQQHMFVFQFARGIKLVILTGKFHYYSPALKKWGLYWICLVLPEFGGSVIIQMKLEYL